jgi:hypothetical protein
MVTLAVSKKILLGELDGSTYGELENTGWTSRPCWVVPCSGRNHMRGAAKPRLRSGLIGRNTEMCEPHLTVSLAYLGIA